MFADDTNLFYSNNSLDTLCNDISDDLVIAASSIRLIGQGGVANPSFSVYSSAHRIWIHNITGCKMMGTDRTIDLQKLKAKGQPTTEKFGVD